MLKLKLHCFGHLMWKTDSLKNTLMLGKIERGGEGEDRGWDGWMASPTLWTWVWVGSESWWWTGKLGVLKSMGWQRVGHDWATELNLQVTTTCLSSLRYGSFPLKCSVNPQAKSHYPNRYAITLCVCDMLSKNWVSTSTDEKWKSVSHSVVSYSLRTHGL